MKTKMMILGIVCTFSACAGLEVGGKVGLYRVDERATSETTAQRGVKPLKCWFMPCPDPTVTVNDYPAGS